MSKNRDEQCDETATTEAELSGLAIRLKPTEPFKSPTPQQNRAQTATQNRRRHGYSTAHHQPNAQNAEKLPSSVPAA